MATATPSSSASVDTKPAATSGMARAAGLTVALVLLSRVAGVLRDSAIAHVFGGGDAVDRLRAAFGVPDLIALVIAGGAMGSVFVPIFTRYLNEDKEEEAWRAFGSIVTIVAVLVAVLVVAMNLAVIPLTALLNAQFTPVQVADTARYTRILLPVQWCLMVGGLLMGTLYARKRFLIPGVGPVLYNVGQIVGCLAFGKTFGLSSVAWGALVGAFCGSIALPLYDILRSGTKWRLGFDFSHPGVQTMGRLMLPALLGQSLSQLNMWLTIRFLPNDGRIAALTNAYSVSQMPIGVFAQAFAIALLPTISVMAGNKDWAGFRLSVSDGLRRVFFLTIPASVLLSALAVPVIRLLYVSGEFTEENVPITATALVGYAVGTFAWSASAILARGFHAKQDTRTPVLVTTPIVALFCGLAFTYLRLEPGGSLGLALITSFCGTLSMCLLLWHLHRNTEGGLDLRGIGASTAKIVLASTVVGIGAWLASNAVSPLLPTGKWGAAMVLVVVGGGACLLYAALCYALRVPELWSIREMFRKPKATGTITPPDAVS